MREKFKRRKTAKSVELRRVADELLRQARKHLATENAPAAQVAVAPVVVDEFAEEVTMAKKRRTVKSIDGRNPIVPEELWDRLVELGRGDREQIAAWMVRHQTDIPTAQPWSLAKGRLDCWLDPTKPHNTTVLARIRHLVEWYPNENPPKSAAPVAAEPMQVPVCADPDSGVYEAAQTEPETNVATEVYSNTGDGPVSETGIVQWVGEFEFRLPSLSRQGADDARVTLTHLAEKLGYSDKAQLKELAKRHVSNLSKFGGTLAVKVPIKAGNAPVRWHDEPLFNEGQAIYLMTESGTVRASDLKADFILAVLKLKGMFERIVKEAPPVDSRDGLILTILERNERAQERRDERMLAAISSLVRPTRTTRARREPDPAQQSIPQTEPTPGKVIRLDVYGHPRINAFPLPNDTPDERLFDSFCNMIDVHGEVTGNFESTHLLAYDEICRSVDPKLTKRNFPEIGPRKAHIKSRNSLYQRRCLEAAYRALIAPNKRMPKAMP